MGRPTKKPTTYSRPSPHADQPRGKLLLAGASGGAVVALGDEGEKYVEGEYSFRRRERKIGSTLDNIDACYCKNTSSVNKLLCANVQ